MRHIILASASPRRKELLAQIGMEFTVMPSTVEEKITSSDPVTVVQELSRQKAMDVAEKVKNDPKYAGVVVLGADTIVVYRDKILGKPADEKEAQRMITMLQGNTHSVYTGVTLICEGKITTFAEETQVAMYPMTKEEIEWYASTGEPLDKAGAYGIQGLCARFIREIHGDYNNVVGLPAARIYQEIKDMI